MISPDVDSAVTRLESEDSLGPDQAPLFGRVAPPGQLTAWEDGGATGPF